jgi:hypothetical protein
MDVIAPISSASEIVAGQESDVSQCFIRPYNALSTILAFEHDIHWHREE